MNKNISIIGAGFSGLAAACYLAKDGYNVTVYEKHTQIGGRARSINENGFTFDMGPSWYWMPDVFERFFADFNKKVSDYYELERLSPGYRVFFKDEYIDVPATLEELYAVFEKHEKGSAKKLKQFLHEAEYKYNVGSQFMYKPGVHLSELLDARLIGGVFKLDVFKSIRNHIAKSFKNPKLVQLLEFPVLFLGALPENTPALYSLMNYADLVLGTWYPKGGFAKIPEGMKQLALELGVKFETSVDVKKIAIENNLAKNLEAQKEHSGFAALISSADYHFTETKLLPPSHRQYSESYWESRKLAPSALMFYIGVSKTLPNLLHHNLFFDEDFATHANEIYASPQWPKKPLLYISATSKTDPTVAPQGHENLTVLIPVAPGLVDTEEIREKYFNLVVDRIEKKIGCTFKDQIVFKKIYAPSNFGADYNSFKNNAYGLANTLMQTAHLKPSIKSKKVKNLFYTGQLTVPGPGVPPSLISGQLVAEQVKSYLSKQKT